LVDEVLAVGDAGFQKKCLSAMEDLRSGGRTVLFVSHNLAAIEALCSRVIWIQDGGVAMDGAPGDVIRSYMTTFVPKQTGSDLGQVEARQGTGEVRFTSIEFLSSERAPQPVTRTGDRVIIRFHYRAVTSVPRASVGFRIYTDLGTLVTSSSTWLHAVEIPVIHEGDGYVDVDIACLTLVPGRYNLSVWISDGGYGSNKYDDLDHCTRLDVEASNFHGSGRNIDSRNGIVYFPQVWDLSGVRNP
jgi:lipopolysaccharide transport system ATP-binding protein